MTAADVVSVRVTFRTVRRGGRKMIVLPEGSTSASARLSEPEVDPILLKAILRAWRWRRAIEEGPIASISEIAEREGLTTSFVGRVLALTTIAPDLLQALLDGQQAPTLILQNVIGSLSMHWSEQRSSLDLRQSS